MCVRARLRVLYDDEEDEDGARGVFAAMRACPPMAATYSKSSNKVKGLTQNPATERGRTQNPATERRVTQNPAREREDLLKIQQEREMSYSKSSKREREGLTQNPATKRVMAS